MIWFNCLDCEKEFRVIEESDEEVAFCPFCAGPVDVELDEDDIEFIGEDE